MELEIIEIKAVGNVKLSLNGKLIKLTEPIWESGQDDSYWDDNNFWSTHPAAFLLNDSQAQLEVTLQTQNAGARLEPGKYTLKGVYKEENREELFIGSGEIRDSTEKIVINVVYTKNLEEFTRFAGKFKWYIRDHKLDTRDFNDCGETGLELFWLYGKRKDPVFYDVFKDGIPVEILRRVAHIYQGTKKHNSVINKTDDTDDKKTLIETVVNSCFYRSPPCYNKYAKILLKNRRELPLNKYLRVATVSCEDQAAVLQVYIKAVGITDVKYCTMNPFGYLRLTRLFGRGFCNNPKLRPYLVYEKKSNRSIFKNHAFCILPENGEKDPCKNCIHNSDKPGNSQKSNCLVVDSCVGPHIGDETMTEYVARAVDPLYPNLDRPIVPPGTVDDIKCLKGVTLIDFTEGNNQENKSEDFKKVMEGEPKEINEIINNFVVRKWSNPKNSRVLKKKKHKWKTFYEDIIPGIDETIKTWILRKKGECIDIDLYVSSEKWASINRFFSIESLATLSLGESPFKKGPKYLGPLSAAIETEDYCRYLWVFYNVVFDVSLHNVTFNIKKLLKWLNQQGRCILKRKKIPWVKEDKEKKIIEKKNR